MGEVRIVRTEVTPLRLMLRPPLATAGGVGAMRAAFILRLFARGGLAGMGKPRLPIGPDRGLA